VQLNPVRGDAALAVDVVEETDPGDAHERARHAPRGRSGRHGPLRATAYVKAALEVTARRAQHPHHVVSRPRHIISLLVASWA